MAWISKSGSAAVSGILNQNISSLLVSKSIHQLHLEFKKSFFPLLFKGKTLIFHHNLIKKKKNIK